MSAPTKKTSRPSISRRRPARAAWCCIRRSRSRRITAPTRDLDAWLKSRGVIGLAGIDTRALTALIREKGMPNAVIAHEPSGRFDLDALKRRGAKLAGSRRHGPGADGDDRPAFHLGRDAVAMGRRLWPPAGDASFNVVAIDYGIKRNILRQLAGNACKVTVVPATDLGRRHPGAQARTAFSSPTARAIRPRPANMPCR